MEDSTGLTELPKNDPAAWRDYFSKIMQARKAAEAQAEENEEPLEILQPSRPAVFDDLNASIKGAIARLTVAGFWSAAQVTVVRQLGTLIKSGEKEGQMRPDKEITNVFLHAANPDRRTVIAWWRDGKLENAHVGGSIVEKMSELEDYIEQSMA